MSLPSTLVQYPTLFLGGEPAAGGGLPPLAMTDCRAKPDSVFFKNSLSKFFCVLNG